MELAAGGQFWALMQSASSSGPQRSAKAQKFHRLYLGKWMCCGAVKATPLVEEESEKNQGFKDYILHIFSLSENCQKGVYDWCFSNVSQDSQVSG